MIPSLVQSTMLNLPKVSLVGMTALIASLNPCTIGIFVLLATTLLGSGKTRKRLFVLALLFISTIFITYILLGCALLFVITVIPSTAVGYLELMLGALIALVGLIHIKDFFWYGKGLNLTIPSRIAKAVQKYATRKATLSGAILLGLIIAIIELPCTGLLYLATLSIVRSNLNVTSLGLVALYAILFALPLLIILFLVIGGTKVSILQRWKEENKHTMRLLIGLLMVALGWILILTTNGMVNFG